MAGCIRDALKTASTRARRRGYQAGSYIPASQPGWDRIQVPTSTTTSHIPFMEYEHKPVPHSAFNYMDSSLDYFQYLETTADPKRTP
ncbi:hypothetical protein BDZ97DRAFT_1923522 [Flammula alnicola]|nr:hypothetical protein BDZ97DRAFT_1923522 [Flammula alnicola]